MTAAFALTCYWLSWNWMYKLSHAFPLTPVDYGVQVPAEVSVHPIQKPPALAVANVPVPKRKANTPFPNSTTVSSIHNRNIFQPAKSLVPGITRCLLHYRPWYVRAPLPSLVNHDETRNNGSICSKIRGKVNLISVSEIKVETEIWSLIQSWYKLPMVATGSPACRSSIKNHCGAVKDMFLLQLNAEIG